MDRILIVDDDIELCSLLVEVLEPEGFDVRLAHDGHSGLTVRSLGKSGFSCWISCCPSLMG